MLMSKNKKIPRPTAAELEILRALWQLGPATVRQVHEVLNAEKPCGYTTVLKFMQIMTAKGLLVRNESQRSHLYQPRVPAENTQRQLVADVLERVCEGSAERLLMHVLSAKKISPQELTRIRKLLENLERQERS
jgi:BlaI family transcriptional regulator, penicillinase repressor